MQPKEPAGDPNEANLRRLFKAGEYHMTMGLRKLDKESWLTMDDSYHQLRAELLTESKSKVFQYLPRSEPACREALEVVLDFLTETWPNVFKRFGANNNFVRNKNTGEKLNLDEIHPLKAAAMLADEDFNILEKSGKDYVL
ncbi:MAG: hypothetical protein M1840_006992 [Geoglossum simile]|nr:MAG: hypothetical protein M1840_006992 [Geoglossum simile]